MDSIQRRRLIVVLPSAVSQTRATVWVRRPGWAMYEVPKGFCVAKGTRSMHALPIGTGIGLGQ